VALDLNSSRDIEGLWSAKANFFHAILPDARVESGYAQRGLYDDIPCKYRVRP
jgi:hypothetical protein